MPGRQISSFGFNFCRLCCDDMGIIHFCLCVSLSDTCTYHAPHLHTLETSYPSHTHAHTNKHTIPHDYLPMRSHVGFLTEWSCQGNGEEMTQGIFSQISPVGILRSGTGPVSSLSPQFSHQTQSECQAHWDTLVLRREGRQREMSTGRDTEVCECVCVER